MKMKMKMKMKINRCGSRGSSSRDRDDSSSRDRDDIVLDREAATMKMKMKMKINRCGSSGVVDLLPHDIMVAILLLIPPRSLLRLKLVCKSWYTLITHPDFIQLHLDHSITNKNPSILIPIMTYGENYEAGPHVLHSLSLNDDGVRLDPVPHSTTSGSRRFWGSCNGLLYLETENDRLCFWNPCTHEYLNVPNIPFEGNLTYASFGFGYDATTDYYKLIRIKSFYLNNSNGGSRQLIETQVLVYTLGLTWEPIGTVPFEVSSAQVHAGLFLNGGLHWIAIAGCGRGMIICIDIATEEYREMSKPESISISKRDTMSENPNWKLIVLKGLLCLTNFVTNEKSIDVWAMKDYYYKDDEPSSWSKLFTIKQPIMALPYVGFMYFELLSGICSKDGDEVLALVNTTRWRRSLVWYNMKNDKSRTIMENLDERFQQVQTCIESLVPLNTGYYNMYSSEEMREEEREEKERQRILRPWKKQKKNNIYL